MFCRYCGAPINENDKVCTYCGVRQPEVEVTEVPVGTDASSQTDSFTTQTNVFTEENAAPDEQPYYGAPFQGVRLQTDRNIIIFVLLTWVTCGIYSFYYYYKLIKDVNTVCAGDGETTPGLLKYILLSIITCGIYSFIWNYKLGERIYNNAFRYGLTFTENGTTILLWNLFGIYLCGLGPLISLHLISKNLNALCDAYNVYNYV